MSKLQLSTIAVVFPYNRDEVKKGDIIVAPSWTSQVTQDDYEERHGGCVVVRVLNGPIPSEVLAVYLGLPAVRTEIEQRCVHPHFAIPAVSAERLRKLDIPILDKPERYEKIAVAVRQIRRLQELRREQEKTMGELLTSIVHHEMVEGIESVR